MDLMEAKYTDIIIYASGFLALVMAIVIVVLCRMQVHPSREPFDTLPVQKLSKFPLRRQVRWHFWTNLMKIPQEHGIQKNILDSNPVCFGPYHSIQWSPILLENQVRHWCGWLVFPPVVPQCWLELWSLNCLMTLTGSFQERSEQYQQP